MYGFGERRDRCAQLDREDGLVNRFRRRGARDESADDDLVLPVDDDRDVPLGLAHVALRAGPEVRGLLVGVDAALLRLIDQETDAGALRVGVDRSRDRAEVGAEVVAERDLDRSLALVVPEVRRELVTDAVADPVDVVRDPQAVVHLEKVPAVVAHAGVLEAQSSQPGRRSAPHVQLDDLRLDRRSARELDDMLAAFPRARAHALGSCVLAHVDA